MKHIKKFNENIDSINEDTTSNFVISKKDKSMSNMKGNSYDYWRGDKKDTIDMEVEVFTHSGHEKEAKLIYDALVAAGLQDRYFKVSVEVK